MDNNNMLGALGEKKNFVTAAIIVLAVLAAFLLVKTFNEIRNADQYPPMNVISVSGRGEVMIVPDIATFSFTVQEEGATVAIAQQKATDKSNKTLEFLKGQGIADEDIKTTGYNINPKYEYQQTTPCNQFGCPPGRSVITGYEVSQTTEVKVRDTAKAGTILSGVGSIGVSNVSGLSFTTDDEEEVKAEAREMAIADAKEKARTLSRELDIRLVKIVSFYEEMPMPYPYYDRAVMSSGMGGDMAQSIPAPELSTGQNKVISQVTISYEIK